MPAAIRRPREAMGVEKGFAGVADVEHTASARAKLCRLDIQALMARLNDLISNKALVSTNFGGAQHVCGSSCQTPLSEVAAGADLIKFGLASQSFEWETHRATSEILNLCTPKPVVNRLSSLVSRRQEAVVNIPTYIINMRP